ncbi:serine/threonine-protein kinase [Chondromyces crocatus]|uniref:non-specific serine/threonine protein kinase n=1 Tax=Chondromyces crocatus TaxID=52 RepID=A0A0K1EJB8_CHOCO|nr:serine/threonine-protein kinase [Chondromyces crocatus]AKT40966.1 uncharacterized protein CMC5_051230 [Chondromyces crocatus]
MSLAPGEIVDGKYRIVRLLGQGGMGEVYEGENTRIRRRVAIKVLHATISAQDESVTRFEREAQAAARIGSDHICEVLDLGALADGTRYMVMEYLDGETLGARIKNSGRLPPDRLIPIMAQVLDGLGAAHAAGIVHRDLKPDNIFILQRKAGLSDFVKILDFGVSKFSQLGGDEMNVTRVGAVVGTPYYMSPEQARGLSVDHRSDVYALGVLLYQAATGQVPFQAATFNELLFKIALEPAPPPQHFVPDLDPDFAAIIQRAMAREGSYRYQSCAEMKDALVAWAASRPHLATAGPLLQAAVAQRPQTQAHPVMPAPGNISAPGFTPAPGHLNAPTFTPAPGHLSAPTFTPAPGNISAPNITPAPGNISAPGFTPAPGHLHAPGFTPAPGHLNAPNLGGPPTGGSLPPGGGAWGNASAPIGVPAPHTASTWGDTSSATTQKKPSKGTTFALLGVGGVVLLGGVLAVLFTSKPTDPGRSPATTPSVAESAPIASAGTPPSPEPPPTAAPIETASAPSTATPAETVAAIDTAAPAATQQTSPPTGTWPPAVRTPPSNTSRPQTPPVTSTKPRTGNAADPGY